MRTFLGFLFQLILVLAPACTSTQRSAVLACDEAAAIALAPQLEQAIANKDKAALARLAVELGAEAFVCGLKSLAAQSAAAGSGSAK